MLLSKSRRKVQHCMIIGLSNVMPCRLLLAGLDAKCGNRCGPEHLAEQGLAHVKDSVSRYNAISCRGKSGVETGLRHEKAAASEQVAGQIVSASH